MEEIKENTDSSLPSLDAFREQIAVRCAVMREAVEKDVVQRDCNLSGPTPYVDERLQQATISTAATTTTTALQKASMDMKKAMTDAIKAAKDEHNLETFGSGARAS
jgi:hypothetical protein